MRGPTQCPPVTLGPAAEAGLRPSRPRTRTRTSSNLVSVRPWAPGVRPGERGEKCKRGDGWCAGRGVTAGDARQASGSRQPSETQVRSQDTGVGPPGAPKGDPDRSPGASGAAPASSTLGPCMNPASKAGPEDSAVAWARHRGALLRGPAHMQSLQGGTRRDRGSSVGPGLGEGWQWGFHGDRASVWEEGRSWRGRWRQLHSRVTVPNAAEPCPEPGWGRSLSCVVDHNNGETFKDEQKEQQGTQAWSGSRWPRLLNFLGLPWVPTRSKSPTSPPPPAEHGPDPRALSGQRWRPPQESVPPVKMPE